MSLRSHPYSQTILFFFLTLMLTFLFPGCQPVSAPVEEPTLQVTATAQPTAAPAEPELSPSEDGAETQALCEESGTIQPLTLDSELLNDVLTFNVYFPPCYDPDSADRYPVLYLLHGQQQDAALWQELGILAIADDLILNQKRSPFLIVMPVEEYFFRSAENNRYPDALLEELLPWVESNLPVCTQKECRAIGGISRGASWAARLALIHWDVFGALGAHSMPLFNGDIEVLPEWIDAIPRGSLPRIYADVGSSDPAVKDVYAFEQALNALGVAHEWHLNSGRHNETYWAEQLPAYLAWYTIPWMEESE